MLELEHLLGQGVLRQGAAIHPSGQYLYASGANILSASLGSGPRQTLLRSLHSEPVSCLALGSTGRLVASAQEGENANVYVWDYITQELLFSLEEHDHRVAAVAFSHDDKLLATLGGEGDGKLIFWDMSNGMIVSSSGRMPSNTTCLAHGGFVKDIKRRDTHKYLLCTAGKNGLLIWELDPFTGILESFPAMAEARGTTSRHMTSIAFSLDRDRVFAATTTGDFLVVNIKARCILAAIPVAKASLESLVVYKHGLIIACADGTLQVFDHDCQFRSSLRIASPAVATLVSPDSFEMLAVTLAGTTLRINLNSFDAVVLSESHTDSVVAVAFPEDSDDRFATASLDGTLKVWDMADYAVITTTGARKEQSRGAKPQCLVFSTMLISGWSDGL